MDCRGNGFIQLRSGKPFWPLDPKVNEIEIADIAFALAQEIRYAGHCDGYSVAQHSVLVSYHCEDSLWGLLHDATEGLGLRDIARPLKVLPAFAEYRAAEKRLMEAVCDRFGLDRDEPPGVKIADRRVFAAEVRDLMTPWCGNEPMLEPVEETIVVWDRETSERRFLERYYALMLARNARLYLHQVA